MKKDLNQAVLQLKVKSKLGALYLVASAKGLQGVFWEKQEVPMIHSLSGSEKQAKILAKASQQLTDYLDGKRASFDLPLDISGTDFQQRVWAELQKIPYGETRSYKEIAHALKNDLAVRAVGAANGRNPLSIIVPCHRVISSQGTLHGYAGGLIAKAKLLEIERQSVRK